MSAKCTTATMKVLFSAVALGLPGLTGCASVIDANVMEKTFADPALFAYYRCEDITRSVPSRIERSQQLKALMAAAEKEPFGGVVAAAAYGDEYRKNEGELRLLAEAAKERRCEGTAAAAAAGQK